MLSHLKRFWQDRDGAVTVDWVVITATICGLAVAVIISVERATLDVSTGLGVTIVDKASKALNENVYP